MPRTRRSRVEPRFLGVTCTGPNPERAAANRIKAEAYDLLAKFFKLDRQDQLIIAAATEEMLIQSEENNNG